MSHKRVATAPTDEVIGAAVAAGKIANPVAKAVTVAGTGALVGGLLTKPETAYSAAMGYSCCPRGFGIRGHRCQAPG